MNSSKSDNIFSNNQSIKDYDSELWLSFQKEAERQEDHIELIASENYASKRILEAQGSLLTNKYAEGYPSKRYYGGCENVDIAENLAIERAKKLFKADYANVQPHSGSSANAAAYLALLEPNDTILGMSLDHGGHLTHGSKVNFSGRNYKSVQYGLHPETNDINYETVFSRQIEGIGDEGDLLVAISTSGNSENVIRAVIAAKKKSITSVSLKCLPKNQVYLHFS